MATRRTAAGVVALGLALGACSADAGRVATLSGSPDGAADQDTQVATAQAMRDCLVAAGVPAAVEPIDQTHALVKFVSEEPYHYQGLTSTVAAGPGTREVTVEEWERMEARRTEQELRYTGPDGTVSPFLFIGDADFTQPWVECLNQTGYTEPQGEADPGDELRVKAAWAQESVRWAQCARDNGYPSTKDPAPVQADGYQTMPTAVLPASIDAGQLRTLLQACPNFAPEGNQPITQEQAEADGGYFGSLDPIIGFDLPGYDGGPPPAGAAVDEADVAHVVELQAILGESLAQFYANQAD